MQVFSVQGWTKLPDNFRDIEVETPSSLGQYLTAATDLKMKNAEWMRIKYKEWGMKNQKWKMKNQKWKIKNEKWKMKNQKWRIKNEKSKMKNQKWKIKK